MTTEANAVVHVDWARPELLSLPPPIHWEKGTNYLADVVAICISSDALGSPPLSNYLNSRFSFPGNWNLGLHLSDISHLPLHTLLWSGLPLRTFLGSLALQQRHHFGALLTGAPNLVHVHHGGGGGSGLSPGPGSPGAPPL